MADRDTPEQSSEQERPWTDLTDLQQRFVLAYCGSAGFNASEAVRQAGYKTKNPDDMGYQLRKTPYISAHITAILSANAPSPAETLHMLRQDATRTNQDILAFAKQASGMAGIPAGAAAVSSLSTARTTARTNLAKAHGLLTDKLHIDADVGVRYEIVGVNPEDLV